MPQQELIVRKYDPRQGEDFQLHLPDKTTFSSKEERWFVLDIFPKRKFLSLRQHPYDRTAFQVLLATSLARTGRLGFFSCSPMTSKVRGVLPNRFNDVHELQGSLLGYFELETKLQEVYELYNRHSSYEEWVIGSCEDRFQMPERLSRWYQRAMLWDLYHLLIQARNIGSLFYFNCETNEAIFLTHMFDGIDSCIDALLEKIARMGAGISFEGGR